METSDKKCKSSDEMVEKIVKQTEQAFKDAELRVKREKAAIKASGYRVMHSALNEIDKDIDADIQVDKAEEILYSALSQLRKEFYELKKQKQ